MKFPGGVELVICGLQALNDIQTKEFEKNPPNLTKHLNLRLVT